MGHRSRRTRSRLARLRREQTAKSQRIKAQIAKERGITLGEFERRLRESSRERNIELNKLAKESLVRRKEARRIKKKQFRKEKKLKARARKKRIRIRQRRKEIRDRGATIIRTRTITKSVPVTTGFKTTTLENVVTTTKEGFTKQKVKAGDFTRGFIGGVKGVVVGTGLALKTVGVLASKGRLGRSISKGAKSFVTQKGGALQGLRRLSRNAARNVAISFAQNPLKATGQLIGSAALFGVAGKAASGLSRLVGKTKVKVSKNVTVSVTPKFSNIRLVTKRGRTIRGKLPSGRKVRTSEQKSRIIADISFRVKLKKGKFKIKKLKNQDIGSLRARAVKNPLVKDRTELLNEINLNVLNKKLSLTEKGFGEVITIGKKKQFVFNLKRTVKALKKVPSALTKKQKIKAIKILKQKIKKAPRGLTIKKEIKRMRDLRRKLSRFKKGKVRITKKTIIKQEVFGIASKPKLLRTPPKIKAFLIKAKTVKARPVKVGVTFVKRRARTGLEKESFSKIQKSVALLNRRIGRDKFQQFLISQARGRKGGRPSNIVVDTFVNQVIKKGKLKIMKGGNRASISLEFPALKEIIFKGRGVGREFRGSRIRNTVKGKKEVELFKKKRGRLNVREASKILRSLEVPKGKRNVLLQKLISKGEVTTIQLSPQFLNSKPIRQLLKKQFKLKLVSTVLVKGKAVKVPRVVGLGVQKPKKERVTEIKKFKFVTKEKIIGKKKKKFRTVDIIKSKFKVRPVSIRKTKAKVTPKEVVKSKEVIKLKTPSKTKVKRKVIIKSKEKVKTRTSVKLKTRTPTTTKLKTRTLTTTKLKTITPSKTKQVTFKVGTGKGRKVRLTFRTTTKFPKGFFAIFKSKGLRRRIKVKRKKKKIIVTAFRSDLVSLISGIRGKIPKGTLSGLEARPIPLRKKGGRRKVVVKRVQKRKKASRDKTKKRVVVKRRKKRR